MTLTIEESVIRKIAAIVSDGNRYATQFYNWDAVISAEYAVNNRCATAFQICSTNILRECLIKRFVIDDECVK